MKQFLKQVFASMIGFLLAHFVIFFGTLFIIGIAIGITASQQKPELPQVKKEDPKILRIDLEGEFADRGDLEDFYFGEDFPFADGPGRMVLNRLEKALEKAAEDPSVKGLYLSARYLSGGWSSLSSLRNAILKFKKSKKFVYAYGNIMSEPLYYVVSAADQIFLYPHGYMNLDGFAGVYPFMKELFEKIEVEPQVFRAGSYKSAIETFVREEMSDENREQTLAYTKDIWQVFVKSIEESRGIEVDQLNKIANDLSVSSAQEAFDFKLIDQLKFGDEVLAFLRGVMAIDEKEKIPFVSYRRYLNLKDNDGFSEARNMIRIQMKGDEVKGKRIAVVYANGDIHGGRGYRDSIGMRTFVAALSEARKDEDVKAVVLRVNSRGGSALASDEILREVILTNKVKPVIASFGDIAASGGYYIAAGARKIFAQPTTITGSIGVFGLTFVTKDLFKNKMGISFDQVVTHKSADRWGSHRRMSSKERFVQEKEIDRIYDRFLQVVEQGRPLDKAGVKEVAGGRVWSGWAAQKIKLVDNFGGLPEAIAYAAQEAGLEEGEYKLQSLPKRRIEFGRFFRYLSADLARSVYSPWGNDVFRSFYKWLPFLKADSRELNSGIYALWPYQLEVK